MSNSDEELEALLRRALHEQASQVQPVGDGLAKIRERATNRQRRLAWMRPGMAVAAAAVAVVAAIGVPHLVHRSGNDSNQTATGTTSQPRRITPATQPHRAAPTLSALPAPSATQLTPTIPTTKAAWPYSDRDSAKSSNDQTLRDPQALAVDFVEGFTGISGQQAPLTLVPRVIKATDSTTVVNVVRGDTNRSVTEVELVNVGDSASPTYLVTAANDDSLAITPAVHATGRTRVPVTGTLTDPTSPAYIWSAMVVPNGSTTGSLAAQPLGSDTPSAGNQWNIELHPRSVTTQPGLVAAWTVDNAGHVLDFAAVPAS